MLGCARSVRTSSGHRGGPGILLRRACSTSALAVVVLASLLVLSPWSGVPGTAVLGARTSALAASPSVSVSTLSARMSPDRERVVLSLASVNAGAAFTGWLEVSGDQRRVLHQVNIPPGVGTLDIFSYPVDYSDLLRVRILDGEERPVTGWREVVFDYSTKVLVVGSGSSGLTDLLEPTIGWLDLDRRTSLDPQTIPLHLYDIVILASSGALGTEGADAALGEWVERGGHLVVVAPTPLPAFVSEFFPQAGFGPQESLESATLLLPTGDAIPVLPESITVAAGTVITPVRMEGGAVWVVTEAGAPVVARDLLGRGSITLVGAVPPSGGGSGIGADPEAAAFRMLWQGVISGYPPGFVGIGSPALPPPHAFVTGRVPSLAWTLLGALLYTAAVGVGSFVLLRRWGRRDAVWWAVPIVVLGATAIVLATGLLVRGAHPELLTRETVSLDHAMGGGDVRLEVGAYAPFGVEYGLLLGEGLQPGRVGDGPGFFDRPYAIRDRSEAGGAIEYEGVSVAPGGGRSVEVAAAGATLADALGSVPLSFERVADGDVVRWIITNSGTVPLRHLILVSDGVHTLPDLAPGASATFESGQGPLRGQASLVGREPPPPDSRDYMEWEAQARLWAEWRIIGPRVSDEARGFDEAVPPAVGDKTAFAPLHTPYVPMRLLAFAAGSGFVGRATGLPSRTEEHHVIVYQVVLR